MLGPYLSFGSNAFVNSIDEKRLPGGQIRWGFGVIRESNQAQINPLYAQYPSARVFWAYWPEMLEHVTGRWKDNYTFDEMNPNRLTLCTKPVSRDEYLRHIRSAEKHLGRRIDQDTNVKENRNCCADALRETLPDKFWLTELSHPRSLLPNNTKFGESILDMKVGEKYDAPDNVPPPLAFCAMDYFRSYESDECCVECNYGYDDHIKLLEFSSRREDC